MARHDYIILFLLLFFSSCGQVGTITGGEEDVTAPRLKTDKVQPPIGSINITPEKITLPFEEFIQLNKPSENIIITPADVKLEYTIKSKSLVLKVKEGEWLPNTTYSIYLNRAVKDITEGNDSIMSYVFSTGSYIDSMQTAVQIKDAYKGDPVANITVGLYNEALQDDTSKASPRYFSLTDKQGIAKFNHIKNDTYYVVAFEDENRNNRLDATEKRAALKNPVTLYVPDTVEAVGPIIQLMPAEIKELKIINNDVLPATSWCIGFNRPLKDNERIEFITPPETIKWSAKNDSVTAYFKTDNTSGNLVGVFHTEQKSDTLRKKYFFREKSKLTITTNIKNSALLVADTLTLTLNQPLEHLESSEIQMLAQREGDSIMLPLDFTTTEFSVNELGVLFNRNQLEKVSFIAPPKTIQGINHSLLDTLKLDFSIQKEKETGTMLIEFDTIPPYGILTVINSGTKEKTEIIFDGISKFEHQLNHLIPGKYQFNYLIDEDRDGEWTTGSIFDDRDPEKMIWIPTISTIRANWEVKTNLSLELE